MTSPECPNPCNYIGHFQAGLEPNHCQQANELKTPCQFNTPCHQKHTFKACAGPVDLDEKSAAIKCEADRTCLYKSQHQKEECCDVEYNDGDMVQTDVPEPPVIQNSPLMVDQLTKELYETSEYKRADESFNPPCYMPQSMDNIPTSKPEPMGPIGPWATGKVDWSPLAGLTGTRPVVDQYSITRYSAIEWRKRNRMFLDNAFEAMENARKADKFSKNAMIQTYTNIDNIQAASTKRIHDRCQLINKWKSAVERAINDMIDEITTLEEQRLRLKKSLSILGTPQAIASECIERRSGRPDTELVRDRPEEELVKELALIAEIRMILNKTLADIEAQQIENRAARNRLEYDWSDKKDAYEMEVVNLGLNNLSTTTMFKPGATRYSEEQSSEDYYIHFSKETLEECEKCRQKSVALRGTLDAILLNAARDLRNQADVIEKAFVIRISCMQENVNRLENELRDCLRSLADTENRIEKMRVGIQGLDNAMKVAQTRLDNRNYRLHVENCRDKAQVGLVEEVRALQEHGMFAALSQSEQAKNELMQIRGRLEREIMLKRQTIMIDSERCMLLRSHFPSANALSGFT